MRRDPTLLILLGIGLAVASLKRSTPFIRKFGDFLVQTGEEIKKCADKASAKAEAEATPEAPVPAAPKSTAAPKKASAANPATKPAAKKSAPKPKQSAPKPSSGTATA